MKKKIIAIICAICVTTTFSCAAMASVEDQPGRAPAQSQQSNAPQGRNEDHAPQGGNNEAPAPKDRDNGPASRNEQNGSQTPPQQPNGSGENAKQDETGNTPENMIGQENGKQPEMPGIHGGLLRYLVESGVISRETADSINEYFSANTAAPESPAENSKNTENSSDENTSDGSAPYANNGPSEDVEQSDDPQQGMQPPKDDGAQLGQLPPQDNGTPKGEQSPQGDGAPQGGQPSENSGMSDTLTAEELNELLGNNIITQEEYDALSEALA